MQPNFLLTGQVYSMTRRKSTLFKFIVQIFLKGVVYMFWHDILYIELLYCVTNFELVWTKVAVVENAKKCRMYPTFPYRTLCFEGVFSAWFHLSGSANFVT